jgi:dipeptidyl aminopeptidase/acylaminoacyl peptidase
LAYERIEPRGEATFSEIYLLDRQTGQQRLWLANDDADREIRWMSWSPDSQRLAVARYQLGQEAVDLTLLDLQKPPQVLIREGETTPFQVPEVAMYDFQWLPDSQRLSFLNHRNPAVRGNDDPLDEFLSFQWLFPQSSGVKSQSSIWILDIRTRQFQELPLLTQGERLGDLSAYTWSPDGQQLALVAGFAGPCRRLVTAGQITCSDHIYVASADGRRLRQLTQVEQWPSYRVLWFSPQRPAGPSF